MAGSFRGAGEAVESRRAIHRSAARVSACGQPPDRAPWRRSECSGDTWRPV